MSATWRFYDLRLTKTGRRQKDDVARYDADLPAKVEMLNSFFAAASTDSAIPAVIQAYPKDHRNSKHWRIRKSDKGENSPKMLCNPRNFLMAFLFLAYLLFLTFWEHLSIKGHVMLPINLTGD